MKYDVICFCHLRWNFVYQRPQHLLTRASNYSRVFVIEEPIFGNDNNYLEINRVDAKQVWVVTPHLKHGLPEDAVTSSQRILLDELISSFSINGFIAWYYSPMALDFSDHLQPLLTVYDCMDELSAFNGAPPQLVRKESRLFAKADIVFTGGHNLYKAKKGQHPNIHPFPSSIDKAHFAQARFDKEDPGDQASIPHPRMGFYGVIDERFNIELLGALAAMKPDWHFIMLGPVVKINPSALPKNNNIHYLGSKSYNVLPAYLGGWDVAIMPFALNRATEFISPTKTPEFLAGGKQVVSTSIKDVVDPYGVSGLVHIADTAEDFAAAISQCLNRADSIGWMKKVDHYLSTISWDKTWQQMQQLIANTLKTKHTVLHKPKEIYV